MKDRQIVRASSHESAAGQSGEPDLTIGALDFVDGYTQEVERRNGQDLEGTLSFLKTPSGVMIHAVDAVAAATLESQFVLPRSFSITLFLGGYSDVSMDGQSIDYGTADHQPLMRVQYNERDVDVVRRSRVGKRMRKINMFLKDEALAAWEGAGFDFKALCSDQIHENFCFHDLVPDTTVISAAQSIIDIGKDPALRERIELERLALTILNGTLENDPVNATRRHLVKAQQARNFIDKSLTQELSLQTLAEEVGMSVSSLQRSFKDAFGCTVITYLREKRLQFANKLLLVEGASVGETARATGYSNVSSFSAAFRKKFGVAPSHVAKCSCGDQDR